MPDKKRPNYRYYQELAQNDPAAFEKVKKDFLRTLRLEHPLERVVQIESVDEEKREVTLSLSSEEPVERFFGLEILGHKKEEINASRLEASAPWLWMHNWMDQRGVIVRWFIKDKKLYVVVRLSKSVAGEELFQDMKDGIKRNASVGYFVEEFEEVTPKNAPRDSPRIYRAKRWCPYEGSSVSVPADITVGVGREFDPTQVTHTPKEIPMNEKQLKVLAARRDAGETLTDAETSALSAYEAGLRAGTPTPAPAPAVIPVAADKAVAAERQRVADINAVADLHPENQAIQALVRKGVKENLSAGEVQLEALQILGKVQRVDSATQQANGSLGMSEEQLKRFSLRKFLHESAEGKGLTGIEAETQQEMVKRGMTAQRGGNLLPFDVLRMARRDLTVGSFANGGALVGSDMVGMVELLRNKSVMLRAGAQMMTGLKGDVYMPRQTGAATLYWVGESTAPTESGLTVGQLQMGPKTGSALSQVSRQLLIQSDPSVDSLLTNDLLKVLALGIDSANQNGQGFSGVPRGIHNWSGIGSFGGGSATLAQMLNALADIEVANADDGTLRWIAPPGVKEILRAKQRFTSTDTPIWTDENKILGHEALSSNQAPSGTLLLGDFSQSVVGIWGPGVELTVNPYRLSNEGLVEYQAWILMDHVVRQAGAFTLATGVTA